MGSHSFRLLSITLIVISLSAPLHAADPSSGSAVADPAATVVSGNVRFTILTPQLLRLEWAANGQFEDHASLLFINRKLPVPHFSRRTEGEWLVLQTEKLFLRYRTGSGRFTPNNLSISLTVGTKEIAWHTGQPDTGNLGGTIRTLDGVRGPTTLEPGLLSRDGWVAVEDSVRPLFDDSDWPWVMQRPPGERQDIYFFGYGHDYRKALYDFTQVAGRIPMPPRFAFGLWWSRYWAYTDEEFKELVDEFAIHDVPLDVLVIDMDWHQTFNLRWDTEKRDQADQRLGWTGYTWDRIYFPDPPAFLSWCDRRGLRTPLNLHPASGIQPHEEAYPAMARAMGIDPATKKYVPFDIVDKKFAENYLNLVIHPLERQGVDFWWLDWQQWGTTKIPGVTPTWWLNYVFFTDMERERKARPLLFHRWGGLGNHRYQIGFSGDAISVWESLAFQRYFTATASNVGFGYWSHDIGGHIPGPVSGELYTRWIQFGIFSPIVRTHTTKNPAAERRIWAYQDDDFMRMRDAILLRYTLIPYIYTASRQAYDSGVSLCRPMYYDYPETPEAYSFTDQYMFGDALLVAPVATPLYQDSMLARQKIWLPPGDWIEWFTGKRLRGPAVVERLFALDQIPVYVRAGAIIPMQPVMRNTHERPVDPLVLTVFPGAADSVRVYEDEGNTEGYQKGECAWTAVRWGIGKDGTAHLEILPIDGKYHGMPEERSYEVRFAGFWPPAKVTCNGAVLKETVEEGSPGWYYVGDSVTTVIRLPRFKARDKVDVTVHFLDGSTGREKLLDGVPGILARLRRVMPLLNGEWPKEWSPDILVKAVQTGNRLSLHPGSAIGELEHLRGDLPGVVDTIRAMKIDEGVKRRVLQHIHDVVH